MKKYSCSCCNYQTDSQYNFKRHQSSSRHLKNSKISPIALKISPIEPQISPINSQILPIEQSTMVSNKFTCKFCHTDYKRKAYLNRHLPKCSTKIIDEYRKRLDEERAVHDAENIKNVEYMNELKRNYEDRISIMRVEKTQLIEMHENRTKKLEDEIDKLRDEIMKMTHSVLKIAEKQATVPKKQTNNNNTQFIINNYKDAPNLEFPIVNWSPEMIEKYVKMGAVRGLSKIITDHWVDNIPPEQRSIWTVDLARNKFLIRIQDAWVVDIDGNKFQEITIDKIYSIFINYMKESKRTTIELVDLMEFICDIRNKNMGMKALKDAGKYLIYDNEKFKDKISLINV